MSSIQLVNGVFPSQIVSHEFDLVSTYIGETDLQEEVSKQLLEYILMQ
jgi:hypothetical protein